MQRVRIARQAATCLACLVLIALPQVVRAQNAVNVNFETIDGVQLRGKFYPSTKGKNGPTVLLLHDVGSDTQKGGWEKLATELQKKEFAVLTFDFRGHGDSTKVDPQLFWNYGVNKSFIKGSAKAKDSIDFKEFQPAYFPTLVNDIGAAKALLDRRNDQQECNSANLIVIGAQEGAVLGTMWIHAEQYRHHLINPLKMDPTPQGKDIAGALWLSLGGSLQRTPMNVDKWVMTAARDKKIPMGFLYGENDTSGKSFASHCVKNIRPDKKSLTSERAVKGSQKLSGSNLLGKSINTEGLIVAFAENVMKQHRSNDWESREFDKNAYVWRYGSTAVAKQEKEKSLQMLPAGLQK